MRRSAKRYVPDLFDLSPVTSKKFLSVAETDASFRFSPLMSRRTGLTVCPAHHEGGSTRRIRAAGACACAHAGMSRTAANAAKSFAADFGALGFIRSVAAPFAARSGVRRES